MSSKNGYPGCYSKFIVIIVIFLTGHLAAQQKSLDQFLRLYQELKFESALKVGESLLQQPRGFSPTDLITIHQYMGVIYYSLGELDSARAHFLSVLTIHPGHELDEKEFSPKIIDFFNSLKSSREASNQSPVAVPYKQYIFIYDKRPAATWRSALLPGWGQIFKGDRKKGYLLGGAFATTVIATGVSYYLENKFHQQYKDAKEPADIRRKYDRYNTWYKTRRSFGAAAIAIWLVNVADALWWPVPEVEVSPVSIGNEFRGLSFSLKF